MIDPVIISCEVGEFSFSVYWNGVLVMLGVIVAAWITSYEFKRRNQAPDYVWDSLLFILPAGVVGARIWYVVNATLGGNMRFINDPVLILDLRQGGLHIIGGILFGALSFYIYAKKVGLDMWLALDTVSPGLLLGQAAARPANFINQELYGPPTRLPWGIRIEAAHRIPPWNDLFLFPEATTRFHPTFAYEMIWNVLAAGVLIYLSRKHQEKIKPGLIFASWLILAGVGQNILDFFRPDQPTFPGTNFSYSRLAAIIMTIVGLILLQGIMEIISVRSFSSTHKDDVVSQPLENKLTEKTNTLINESKKNHAEKIVDSPESEHEQ